LPDVDHHRDVERARHLLGAPQRLEVVLARDVVGQPCLDADHDVTVADHGAAREVDVRRVDVLEFAARRDAGACNVDQGAADLRRAARDRGDLIDIVGAARAGVDPAGDAVLEELGGPSLLRPAWVWMSIRPGVTILPLASIVSAASPVIVASTAAILPPAIATSRTPSSMTDGSTTRPPLMMRS
jgi:hypothetical protein